MKKFFALTAVSLLVPLMLVVPGCSGLFGSDSPPAESVSAVSFKKTTLTVPVGGSEYLPVTIKPAHLQNAVPVIWDYEADRVAINADAYGVVITGRSEGSSYIKATVNGITATCMLTVQGAEGDYTGQPYIYANLSVVELTPGSAQTVSVSLYGGQSFELEDFSFSAVDPSVAAITSSRNNCVVTALQSGSTQITASHPKCAYPYTFVVYVYTDELSVSYLSTASNIITINKTMTPSQTVTVDVHNPPGLIRQNGFTWEIVSREGEEGRIALSANGPNALLTPIAEGLALIRVRYEGCQWPLDLLVRVTSTVQNVYITPSTTTLVVTGSSAPHSVYADITGYSGFVNPNAFVWTVDEDAARYFDYETMGNTLTVTGKINGAVKVKVAHELAEYSRNILIILREQEGSAIDASMYITTGNNYIQTKIGADTIPVAVTLAGGLPGDEQNLLWKIDNGANNDVCLIETASGAIASRAAGRFTSGTMYLTPRNMGTTTVTVSHPKVLYETDIVIKVYSAYAQLEEPAVIESDTAILRLLNGTTREVSVNLSGNVTAGDENGISWRSDNEAVISLSPPTGSTVIASAGGTGDHQTYLSAAHGKAAAEKRILALSADTQAALDAMKGIYADQTYFRINVNETSPVSLNHFGLTEADIAAITWTTDRPGVCMVNALPGNRLTAALSGISSGTAVITAALSGAEPCRFSVTVLPEGENRETILPRYLTTAKNASVLSGPGAADTLRVTGVNISPATMATATTWQVQDPEIVSLAPSGAAATITALKIGRTTITATNEDSANSIVFDLKVGALYEWDDSALVYITAEQDVLTLVKGEQKTIGAALVNSTPHNGFTFSVSGAPLLEVTGSLSGSCFIQAREAGISEITIRHPLAAAEKEILVVIANSPEELRGFPYLTTKHNVVTLGASFHTTVSVSVTNAPVPVVSGYHWVSSDPAVVRVVDSGQTAVFYGERAGTAKITVTNDALLYPLEIIAHCVNPVLAANNPYIMSATIVTLTVGDAAATVSAELVGGSPADYSAFSWQTADGTIASCLSSNETAQVKALKEGVTQLRISHPKAGGIDRTILVICEPRKSADCYITTTESIIRLSPGDSPKTITATLTGGTANDPYAFKWWADSYQIIEMNYTGAQAVIKPLAAGSVTLHVSHPKAVYQKDIILNISQYTEFAFETTARTVPAGIQTFVNMRVPVSQTTVRVAYTSRTPGGADASHLVAAGGTNAVCILDPREAGTAVITASLIAVNSGAVQATAELLELIRE